MSQAFILNHPLVAHHISRLRDRFTAPAEFRAIVQRLAGLLAFEALRDLELAEIDVETPLCTARGYRLRQRIGVVPILRAGLGMVDPILHLLPEAEVWHLGLYRDEQTLQPVEYYHKLPSGNPVDVACVLDPMLATGGSVSMAVAALKRWGCPQIKVLSIIAAPEGVAAMAQAHPEVQLHACIVDERLNDIGYIVPGLGDAGDRTFNTLDRGEP